MIFVQAISVAAAVVVVAAADDLEPPAERSISEAIDDLSLIHI